MARPYLNENLNPPAIDTDQLYSNARFKKWFMPVLDALISLGGEAPRQAVHEKIIATHGITDEELAVKNKSGNSVVINDIDWARNYLNYERFLDSSVENGIWKLTDIGKKVLVSDDLAGKIIAKWVIITKAKRENMPIKYFTIPNTSHALFMLLTFTVCMCKILL